MIENGADFDNVNNSTFYQEVTNHIAHEIINYDKYNKIKYNEIKLAFARGNHERLGENSDVCKIDNNTIKNILDLVEPPKIELNKMQKQHRTAVEQRISELQQEEIQQTKDTPGNSFGADGVTQISPSSLQNGAVANPI